MFLEVLILEFSDSSVQHVIINIVTCRKISIQLRSKTTMVRVVERGSANKYANNSPISTKIDNEVAKRGFFIPDIMHDTKPMLKMMKKNVR